MSELYWVMELCSTRRAVGRPSFTWGTQNACGSSTYHAYLLGASCFRLWVSPTTSQGCSVAWQCSISNLGPIVMHTTVHAELAKYDVQAAAAVAQRLQIRAHQSLHPGVPAV